LVFVEKMAERDLGRRNFPDTSKGENDARQGAHSTKERKWDTVSGRDSEGKKKKRAAPRDMGKRK